MSAATHNVKKVAEHRQRILTLLLNNKELVDGILGRPGMNTPSAKANG